MTILDLFGLVRQQINDVAKVRWSDATMLTYYNMCRQVFWNETPFVFYLTSIITAYPGDVSDDSIDIDFGVNWSEAAVSYLCYKCYSEDSEDANMQVLAKENLEKFVRLLS